MEETKKSVSDSFNATDGGEASQIVGIRITRHPNFDITIDQTAYINRLVQDLNMTNSNGAPTPVSGGDVNNSGNTAPLTNTTIFRNIVGKLM